MKHLNLKVLSLENISTKMPAEHTSLPSLLGVGFLCAGGRAGNNPREQY